MNLHWQHYNTAGGISSLHAFTDIVALAKKQKNKSSCCLVTGLVTGDPWELGRMPCVLRKSLIVSVTQRDPP